MELYQLRYFLKVAEELNFRSAAKMLFISQPALSQQIIKLEKELGVSLFYRDNQKVCLLPAGEVFREKAIKIIEQVDELALYMKTLEKSSEGQVCLRIGLDKEEEWLASAGITNAILSLNEKNPEMKIELIYISFEQAQEAFEKEQIDVGFFALRDIDYELFKHDKKILWEDRLCLAAHNSLQGTAKDILQKYPLIQLKEDHRWEAIIRKKAKQIYPNYQVTYVDSIAKSMDYMALRNGIVPGILSQVQNDPMLRVVENKNIPEDKIIVAALWNSKNNITLINKLIDEIKR